MTMEKVLETIDKIGSMMGYDKCGFRLTFPREQAAKEIHEHYMEFTDWMMKGTIMPDPDDSSKYWDCLPMIGEVSWTLDEVYSYYCKKVLNQ